MRGTPVLVLSCLIVASALAARAQATGTASAAASAVESGGPDVSHVNEDSLRGFSLSGALSSFMNTGSLQADWKGIGQPDYHLRGAYVLRGWTLEASVNQRAYLAGQDARFAWNPWDGDLDLRVPSVMSRYRPFPGSPMGHFDPATIPEARGLLPENSPGWTQTDSTVTFRTTGAGQGFSITVSDSERRGMMPRTFVLATGFSPFVTPLTQDLPVGNPLGVVEVPERYAERDISVGLQAFRVTGRWRWEGEASFGRYRLRRLATYWASPFPGPALVEPNRFWGSQGRLRLSIHGPDTHLTLERSYSRGQGDGGRRVIDRTVLRATYEQPVNRKVKWFVRADGFDRQDSVTQEPPVPSPVFRGPYYGLLPPRMTESFNHAYPQQAVSVQGGLKGRSWEASTRWTHTRSPEAYARRLDTVELVLVFSPAKPFKIDLRPFWTWAGAMDPTADTLDDRQGWAQATNFRPADARNWQGIALTAQYRAGPLLLRYAYGTRTSPPDIGLRRRDNQELFASFGKTIGPWSTRATARAYRSTLALTATTYAYSTDALDPEDPSHRAPMGEEWLRQGASGDLSLERSVGKDFTVGAEGRWEYQVLSTRKVLDDPRSCHYLRAGAYLSRSSGAFGFRAEAGVEQYLSADPAFLPQGTPPGPYLWAGLTERPGTRGYASFQLSFKF